MKTEDPIEAPLRDIRRCIADRSAGGHTSCLGWAAIAVLLVSVI
jgi:hypothetical protein